MLLLLCAALFLALRLPWREHLLMWDEAMNLCSVRAFVGGGHDPYSEWFWRYPPLFHLLMVAVRPLEEGYVSRVEWIPITVGLVTMFVLAALNRRLFGNRVALLSAACLAVMPGAVFYGVWIKQDCAATLFGLLTFYFLVRRSPVPAGVSLGLALLSKQFAIFFALSVAIVLISEKRYRDLVLVAAVSACVSLWWYAFFATGTGKISSSLLAGAEECWLHPWHYYLGMFRHDLGWFGILAALGGTMAIFRHRDHKLWPLALAIPVLVILSCLRCKTPWYAMMLFPALATCQAVCFQKSWEWIGSLTVAFSGRFFAPFLIASCLALLALPLSGRNYETMMVEREPMMWEASYSSRQAAETLNGVVLTGEKVLITTMHYYGDSIRSPCPIFVIYLKDMPVLVRSHHLTIEQLLSDVRKHQIDWVMVSPAPGQERDALVHPLVLEHGLHPISLRDASIFKTTSIHGTGRR